MNPYHRNVLLEANYALEHLLWSYRSQLDQEPTRNINVDEVCLSDFAGRTASLVRGVLDDDNKRSGPRLAFRPPTGSDGKRLAAAITARREALAAKHSIETGAPAYIVDEGSSELPPVDESPDSEPANARESCSSFRGFRRRPR